MSSVTSVPICPKRFCGSNIFRVNPVFVLNLFERHSTGKAANHDPDRNAGAPYHGLAMANHRVNRDPIVVCHFAAASFARTEVSARGRNHARTESGDQVDDVGITHPFLQAMSQGAARLPCCASETRHLLLRIASRRTAVLTVLLDIGRSNVSNDGKTY